jgi:hypothetical protein
MFSGITSHRDKHKKERAVMSRTGTNGRTSRERSSTMSKHVLIKVALALPAIALSVLGITSTASASTGPSPGPPSSHSAVQGHFKASYPTGDTSWSCSGVRVSNRGAGTFDSETCAVTGVSASDVSQFPAGSYTNGPGSIYGTIPFYGHGLWQSDFDGQTASSWTISLSYDATGGADGTATVTVIAYY